MGSDAGDPDTLISDGLLPFDQPGKGDEDEEEDLEAIGPSSRNPEHPEFYGAKGGRRRHGQLCPIL
jgi:hypothetical protein